jgi:Carboxypeptidase regulatory-like domain
MRNRFFIVCSGLIFMVGATALAEQGFVPPQSGVRFLERYRPATAKGEARIIGTVIDSTQVPVRNARLHLRNLTTGNVDQEGTSNDNGEFEFTILDPGTYVVEMVSADGFVVALSSAGSLARYETFQTRVLLSGRWDYSSQGVVMDQNVATYLGVSGQLTMTSRTLELAIEQNITPKDSGEPVSP